MVKHPVSSKAAQDFIDNVYQDRGMMKWKGFMISDHKDMLDKQKKVNSNPAKLNQQDKNTILKVLNKSYTKKLPVNIQFNYLVNDVIFEVRGVVMKFNEDKLALKRSEEIYEIEDIRNVKID